MFPVLYKLYQHTIYMHLLHRLVLACKCLGGGTSKFDRGKSQSVLDPEVLLARFDGSSQGESGLLMHDFHLY